MSPYNNQPELADFDSLMRVVGHYGRALNGDALPLPACADADAIEDAARILRAVAMRLRKGAA